MTCDVYLDEDWKPVGYDLYPALMRSCARLAYGQVLRALQGAPLGACGTVRGLKGCAPEQGIDDAIMQRVESLSEFARARIARRHVAGGLDFEFPEARVVLDGAGKPCGVDLRVKNQATSLVEEAMILANEVVAAHLHECDFPALYRVHEKPSPDSLAALLPVLSEFSWFDRISPERFVAGDPHVVQQVLSESRGRLEADLVQALVLRAMKRACYKPQCEGHYGLASAAYAHFTSPIRRYPDLVVHRMLRAQLTRRPQRFEQEVAALPWIAEHSSDMERVAEKAARKSQELKLVEYMARFVGQNFTAAVSGVAAYGMYVKLDNTAEGLVAARHLGGEYFALDAAGCMLVGQDSGRVFRLGQRVDVVLEAADARAGRLDFRLA